MSSGTKWMLLCLAATCITFIDATLFLDHTGRQLLDEAYPTRFPMATMFEPTVFSCKRTGRFPFIASIKDRTLAKKHICGGILIAENAVLTAAHCVDPRATRQAIVQPQVHLGGTSLESPIEVSSLPLCRCGNAVLLDGQILETVRAFPHPKWTGDIRDGHDLVILKLAKKSCLMPIANIGNRKFQKKGSLQFFGYGRGGQAGAYTNLLQISPLSFVPNDTCTQQNDIEVRDNEICFTGETSISVCSGDDGGPLMVPPSSLFAFYEEVIGIVSYTTGNCDEQGAAVFMDLAAFGRWINKTLKSKKFRKA